MVESVSFWRTQCPSRGPVLWHRHWTECEDHHIDPIHEPDQCCHCGARESDLPLNAEEDMVMREAGIPPEALPPIDVNARMRALGFLPAEEGDDDPIFREAKAAQGGLPSGPPWERGRSWYGDGGLSPRDKSRLGFILDTERRRGYR